VAEDPELPADDVQGSIQILRTAEGYIVVVVPHVPPHGPMPHVTCRDSAGVESLLTRLGLPPEKIRAATVTLEGSSIATIRNVSLRAERLRELGLTG
jgi:hypothetical protein